jgi:hypothetical protein
MHLHPQVLVVLADRLGLADLQDLEDRQVLQVLAVLADLHRQQAPGLQIQPMQRWQSFSCGFLFLESNLLLGVGCISVWLDFDCWGRMTQNVHLLTLL